MTLKLESSRGAAAAIMRANPLSAIVAHCQLTRTATGRVYIRYLPPGVNAGAPGGKYLIVATYPFTGAYRALQTLANGKGISVPGHGIAYIDPKDPTSVHLAYPGINFQVEVYDPSPARSLRIARSGDVRPVAN